MLPFHSRLYTVCLCVWTLRFLIKKMGTSHLVHAYLYWLSNTNTRIFNTRFWKPPICRTPCWPLYKGPTIIFYSLLDPAKHLPSRTTSYLFSVSICPIKNMHFPQVALFSNFLKNQGNTTENIKDLEVNS